MTQAETDATRGSPRIETTINAPACGIPSAWLLGYPTRLVDAWAPGPEHVLLPSYRKEPTEYTVRVVESTTAAMTPRPPMKNPFRRRRWTRSTLDAGDRLVFDVRQLESQRNIAHIIDSAVSRIFLAKRALERETAQPVPIHALVQRYGPITHAMYEFFGIPLIVTDCNVRGRIVTMSPIDPPPHHQPRSLYPELFRFRPIPDPPGPAESVYIARRDSRGLINERQVSELLAERGFRRVFMEDLALPEQWNLIRDAERIVAIHGAALVWLVARAERAHNASNDRGTRLVELFSSGYVTHMYRELAAAMGLPWVGVRGRITPEVVRELDVKGRPTGHRTASFEIDLEALRRAVDDELPEPPGG